MFLRTIIALILCYVCIVVMGDNATEYVSPVLNRPKKFPNRFSFAGKTYYVDSVFKTNFFKAVQFCRLQGMQLWTINNNEEDARMVKFLQEKGLDHRRYWTSGANLGDRDQWVWLSTGLDVIYANWPPGQPSYSYNGKEENCIEYRGWGGTPNGFAINDMDCMAEFYFICESSNDCANCRN
ncbi:C-type lectin 37Db-like [Diorhabda carinulata]|uniref:C-type lectin 37Db-like n=1 Tax=Diorhabda carinulata TaxID=1163345 RepID=UPI0025A27B65|nr:C-type lectin 37Db-like [Diorhabda carinulata]